MQQILDSFADVASISALENPRSRNIWSDVRNTTPKKPYTPPKMIKKDVTKSASPTSRNNSPSHSTLSQTLSVSYRKRRNIRKSNKPSTRNAAAVKINRPLDATIVRPAGTVQSYANFKITRNIRRPASLKVRRLMCPKPSIRTSKLRVVLRIRYRVPTPPSTVTPLPSRIMMVKTLLRDSLTASCTMHEKSERCFGTKHRWICLLLNNKQHSIHLMQYAISVKR